MSDSGTPISRRRLIIGAGAAGLAALISACRTAVEQSFGPPSSPTPDIVTSMASATPSQTATVTPAPTAQGTEALSSPTSDTLPSPTEAPLAPTPEPSQTPIPPATPFPGGPPSKLGLLVAWYHPQVMELIATGNIALLKTLELDPGFLAAVKRESPETVIVGRVMLDQIDLNRTDMAGEARRSAEAVLPLALDPRRSGLVDAWEGFNEPVPGNEEQMYRLAEMESERVRLLAEKGLRAVIGNFGAGQPALEWWPAFRPALEAARAYKGFLGLHEYSAPTIWFNTNRKPLDFGVSPSDHGWLTLRYRKVYQQYLIPWGLELPLLMTECGVDGLVRDRPGPQGRGYKDFGPYWEGLGMGPDTAGNYVEQLAWYDAQMNLDEYVRGSAVFAMTAFGEWNSYELLGDAAAILQQYLSVHPAS